MDARIQQEFARWQANATQDADVVTDLQSMAGNEEAIADAFYRDLEFGTAGLRGVLGAGTNRMNIHVVAKASQGLANYVCKAFAPEARRIAISYDSRIKSAVFSKVAASVFAANGIKTFIYSELMPVPCASYATRELKCAVGIMVTASHNPAKYNGYKVYGGDGCQMTDVAAAAVLDEINKLDIFADVKSVDFEEALASGIIEYISEDIYTGFVEKVKGESVLGKAEVDRNVAIVYSPLHGAGLKPVLRCLKESGFTNITVVKEQEEPDGNFTTCPYPNPEIREAMALGIEYAKKYDADLLLATDPDSDRVGIAVKNAAGEHVLLTGNETGMLLLDYICTLRKENGIMPEDPVFIKTIVTTDMAEQIATAHGVRTINVLTGFKYIGEQIAFLEAKGKERSYILGFEESYGYLTGSYVRDKDAVNASLMICEMFAYYKTKGISLAEKLNQLYETYGYCLNKVYSYEFAGAAGFAQMAKIIDVFRNGKMPAFGGKKVLKCLDYSLGLDGLPKSNVLKFILEDNCSVVVRPSGTEPKLKTYLTVSAATKAEAEAQEQILAADIKQYIK